MEASYSPQPWHPFFIGVAGAAGPLIGLLFVSLSINLRRILEHPWLPRRAAVALLLMFEALTIAIVGLVPGQGRAALGVELLVVGVIGWLFATVAFTIRRPATGPRERLPIVVGAIMAQLGTVPVLVAGVSELAGAGGGLYWLVPAMILLLGLGIMSAWILLIEILR